MPNTISALHQSAPGGAVFASSARVADIEVESCTLTKASRREQHTSLRERDALYQDFQPLVRRLIRQYGQTPEFRQDLEGEIYYRFCRLLDVFDCERGIPLRPYLVRQLTASVYTFARHHWRLSKREVELKAEASANEAPAQLDPTGEWIDALSQQDVMALVSKSLGRIPLRQQRIVLWRYYDELSFDEIADHLQVQPATVRSLLRHGLNNLRKQFNLLDKNSPLSGVRP